MVNKIKEIAKNKGMSISEIEQAAGLSHGSIGKWDQSKPLAENLYKVATILDTSVEELLKEDA